MNLVRLALFFVVTGLLGIFPGLQSGAFAADETFHAVLIGTGIPIPNSERACAATLIVAADRKFLVDTGRGSFMRLVETQNLDVTAVLYTHFHNDHISELGEFMVNRAIGGAKLPMRVLGPKGTRDVADALLAPYERDTEYRVAHHGEKYSAAAMTADVEEHEAGVIYEEDGLIIRMFEVDHHPIEPAVGYRFEFQGKSIVISGDTKKAAIMVEMAKDCDLLIHEAMNTQVLKGMVGALKRGNPRQSAMLEELMDYHTDKLEVAEIARDAGAKKVVLTHLVPSIPPTDAAEKMFVRGVSDIYKGEVIMARDGMVVKP